MNKSINTSPNFFQAFFLVFQRVVKVSPKLFSIGTVLNIIDGLSFAMMVPITQFFLDQATEFATSNNGNDVKSI